MAQVSGTEDFCELSGSFRPLLGIGPEHKLAGPCGLGALQAGRRGEVVRALDERGILNSIASKNDEGYAMEALRAFHLDHYFLSPQISWNPKSQMIGTIAESLNIATESLVFVDDSPFERAEVSESHPEVVVIDAADVGGLLDLPQFDVPVTKESRQRRNLYRTQERRTVALKGFNGSYLNFLQDCQIELTIQPLSGALLDRVYELAQRTNQMNFSGNRYDRRRLEEIASNPALETFVIGCRDHFGDYGIIGFSVVERHEPRMIDLMFSCRVQGKRVEHAFLTHLLGLYKGRGFPGFHATYRITDRNKMSGRVFDDLNFACLEVEEAKRSLYFAFDMSLEDESVIEIVTKD
jgi:FkbH-like protein